MVAESFVAAINTYNSLMCLFLSLFFSLSFFFHEDQEYIYSSTTPNINNKTSYRMLTLLCLFFLVLSLVFSVSLSFSLTTFSH